MRQRQLIALWMVCCAGCGWGHTLEIAPEIDQGRCREYIDHDFADFLINGETLAFVVFDIDDTGLRSPVAVASVRSADPSVFEVVEVEDAVGDDFARITLQSRSPGQARLQIETHDGATTSEVIVVVDDKNELPTGVNASCPFSPSQ
jgi:hypothetical protein